MINVGLIFDVIWRITYRHPPYGNGTEHDRFYNLDGNIYSLWYGNVTRDIAYDAAGRIQAFMNSDLPVYQEFTYDTVDRLTGHTLGFHDFPRG